MTEVDRSQRMAAIVLTQVGGLEHLATATLDVPSVAPDEVLIRVATVGVNRQDLNLIVGRIPTSHLTFPHVLGLDPAGVVAEVGEDVSDVAVGDRVVVKPPIACGECAPCQAAEDDACERISSVGIHRPGGMAEYVAVPSRNVAIVDSRLTDAEATAVAHTFPVALTLLRRASVSAQDTLLVSGAAGAVGSATVQLARSLGARVIAAVGSKRGAEWLRALPAASAPHAVVEYGPEAGMADAIREAAPAGVDVYVETAADPAVWDEALSTLARRGRIAVIGSHAGPIVKLNTNWLFRQRVTIFGCSGSTLAAFHESITLAGNGAIVPNIDSILPMGRATEAYERLAERENQGKVVLRVADGHA